MSRPDWGTVVVQAEGQRGHRRDGLEPRIVGVRSLARSPGEGLKFHEIDANKTRLKKIFHFTLEDMDGLGPSSSMTGLEGLAVMKA